MRFLHINRTDKSGGAAISMYRLHLALREAGHESRILCGRKYSDDKDVFPIIPGEYGHRFGQVSGILLNKAGLQSLGNPSALWVRGSSLIREWADVVVLKNLQWDYFSLGVLPWIARQRPIIWRLADMWPFTGHCAYALDCERWEGGCGKCPRLGDDPGLPFDTTHFLWNKKREFYSQMDGRMVIVCPSQWLSRLVARSPLLKRFPSVIIPTAVDTDLFCPDGQKEARRSLAIDPQAKVIMISGANLTDPRKGRDVIIPLMETLVGVSKMENIVWLFLGNVSNDFKDALPESVKVVFPGFISNDKDLVRYYQSSDVYVCLSRADNLPNTLVEAAACGLPAVTLDVGGCQEAVVQGKSGFAVKTIREVADAVLKVLRAPRDGAEFRLEARSLAERCFSMKQQVIAYERVGEELRKSGASPEGGQ